MQKLLTQITIINDTTGKKKISYTYDEVDENGETQKSNQKRSFLVMDGETETLISNIEEKVDTMMNAQ